MATATAWPEHLTKDHLCWVYWRGIQVEHYTFSDPQDELRAAKDLAERCRHLEGIGVPVNSRTAIWFWSWFAGMKADHPHRRFMSECFSLYEHKERGLLGWVEPGKYPAKGRMVYWDRKALKMGSDPMQGDESRAYYHMAVMQGWSLADAGQGEHCGVCYATTEGMEELLRRYVVPEEAA
jgi:hypothetical protein